VIQPDGPASSAVAAEVSSLTIPLTISNQIDRFLAFGGSLYASAGQSITGVTFDGVGLNRHIFATFINNRAEFWYGVAPHVGTFNLVVTFSAVVRAVVGVRGFFGVDQLTPLGNAFSASGTSTSPSVSVNFTDAPFPISSELCLNVLAARENSGGTLTATASGGMLEAWNMKTTTGSPTFNNILGAAARKFGDANPTVLPWTLSDSVNWVQVGTHLKPSRARISFAGSLALAGDVGSKPFDRALEARLMALEADAQQIRRRLRMGT